MSSYNTVTLKTAGGPEFEGWLVIDHNTLHLEHIYCEHKCTLSRVTPALSAPPIYT